MIPFRRRFPSATRKVAMVVLLVVEQALALVPAQVRPATRARPPRLLVLATRARSSAQRGGSVEGWRCGCGSCCGCSGGGPASWLPEKYRVMGADGKALDVEASAKKVAAAHGELEKRLGQVGAPPAKPEEYKTDAALEELKKAARGQGREALRRAREGLQRLGARAKLTQAQYDKRARLLRA
jgi:hypothetical protein